MDQISGSHLITLVVQNGAWTPLGSINLAGYITGSRGLEYQKLTKRVLGSYALIYTAAGSCDYLDDLGRSFELVPGDFLLLFPEIGHYYAPKPGARWDEYFFIFKGPIFDLWRQHGLLDPQHPVLHGQKVWDWTARLMGCVQESGRAGIADAMHQICQLQVLLSDLQAQSPQVEATDRWLEEACRILGDGHIGDLDIRALASSFGLRYETFRKHFTALMGISPSQYRLARCIDHASELLMAGSKSNKEIALDLGFCDEYHFSKRFKQITGIPPRMFRRQVLGGK